MRILDINESTKIPLTWIFSLIAFGLPLLIGFVFWLSTLYSSVTSANTRLDSYDIKVEKQFNMLIKMDKKLQRIEDKLKIKTTNQQDGEN